MLYEDRVAVVTPEGLALELVLAGPGSRFGAALIDALIQAVVLAALVILVAATRGGSGTVLAAVFLILGLLVLLGYHIAFETLRAGRTPGKKAFGLRVVRAGGGPVTFAPSALRNVLRLVDFLPFAYLSGLLVLLVTPRNQWLGDLAGGTLVVREARALLPAVAPGGVAGDPDRGAPVGAGGLAPAWDVSSVTPAELAAVRAFLSRRPTLDPGARARLAWELASRLGPKVSGPDPGLHPETFLEQLVAVKLALS